MDHRSGFVGSSQLRKSESKSSGNSRNLSSRFDLSRRIEERSGPLIPFEGRRYQEFWISGEGR
jgi:hypothetical protein